MDQVLKLTEKMKLLDGKATSASILEELCEEVKSIVQSGKRPPHLAAVLVGDNPASETYVGSKIKACEKTGFESTLIRKGSDITKEELLAIVKQMNEDPTVDGILVQLPLPPHIPERAVIDAISPDKDVDGFNPENMGRMTKELPCFLPATPGGVMELLKRYEIPTKGKHAVVVGRSNIVGTPMSILLSRESDPGNCTVTLTHIFTENLEFYTRQADILVVAVGKPNLITADMVKDGAVVVDVGINRVHDPVTGKKVIVGDVDFPNVSQKCSFITPVPGGVGPMTIAQLMLNTMMAYKMKLS